MKCVDENGINKKNIQKQEETGMEVTKKIKNGVNLTLKTGLM
jgi:hypothetical protein